MLRRRPNDVPRPAMDLAREREARGVSLDDVMEQTKLSRRFLEAIERGAYEELPGGIFTISYLRQYAGATGVDAGRLLEQYRRETGVAEAPQDEDRLAAAPRQGWLRLFLG